MFVDLPKKIIEAKEKGYINSRLEIIVDTPPQWVLDELDKFFKDFVYVIVIECGCGFCLVFCFLFFYILFCNFTVFGFS